EEISGRTPERMRGGLKCRAVPRHDGSLDLGQPFCTVDEEYVGHLGNELVAAKASPQLVQTGTQSVRQPVRDRPATAGGWSHFDGGEEGARIDRLRKISVHAGFQV